jgi:CRISPR-associated protein Cas5t
MSYLVVEIACQSCSFRIPEFQNFHKTYELPPPTTIIGLAGAAMGLSPKASQEFFKKGFEFGICGRFKGKSNDLWKYQKLKGKEFISDILTREVLFENRFVIVFGNENQGILTELQMAFENPRYALTLGNSDGLAKIITTKLIPESTECDEIRGCLVEGNLFKEVLDQPLGLEFSFHHGVDPVSFEIPMAFSYESDYGVRKVVRRKEFSFISSSASVKGLKKKGIHYGNFQIPLFKIDA